MTYLDKNINELVSIDIEILKKGFLSEIEDVSLLNEDERNDKLAKIFESLFRLQPDSFFTKKDLSNKEQRLFVDLISTPGLLGISYVRDYLNKLEEDCFINKKKMLLRKIYNYYDSHSKEEIDKFNYVFRSSSNLSYLIIEGILDFEDVFNDRIFSLFDKETLSLMYRGSLTYKLDIESFKDNFLKCSDKSLFLMSIMADKMKNITGHNNEFIYSFMNINFLDMSDFDSFLKSFYDAVVDDEEKFRDDVLNNNSCWELNELINLITTLVDPYFFINMNTFDKFKSYILEEREAYSLSILKEEALDNISNSNFDIFDGFREILNEVDLEDFKAALLFNLYGVSLTTAKSMMKMYATYIDSLKDDIIDSDKKIFELLQAIKNIIDLNMDDDNYLDKLNVLRISYYKNILRHGINYRDNSFSYVILEGLFNKMYMNTYNKRLLKIDNNLKLLEEDEGVKLYDSGVNFNMMLSCLGANNKLYSEDLNISSQWNTSFYSNVNGLCCSYVNNQNLGVIKLSGVMLGFDYFYDYSLNKMGVSDIFSLVSTMSLRKSINNYHVFCPSLIVSDETRYGYNEFLMDRFLLDDKDDKLKLQPSYVVFYKFDDDFKNSNSYKESLRVAKEFDIPIIVVDVEKVKENERAEIKVMEEELFSSSLCNSSLMRNIVVRYMNNYTGSLGMVGNSKINYKEDFSVKGMGEFFDRVISKINRINEQNEKNKWIDALESIYLEEEMKYKNARRIPLCNNSIKMFGLKKYDLRRKIECLRNGSLIEERCIKSKIIYVNEAGKILYDNDIDSCSDIDISEVDLCDSIIKIISQYSRFYLFIKDDDLKPEIKTILNFMKDMKEYHYSCSDIYVEDFLLGSFKGKRMFCAENKRMEKVLVENLVMSYFFESDKMIIDDLICHDFDWDVSFNSSDDFDFVKCVGSYHGFLDKKSSNYVKIDSKFLEKAIMSIEYMEDDVFLNIFNPVIKKYCDDNNVKEEVLEERLLNKKYSMREAFNKLEMKDKSLNTKVIRQSVYF